VVGLLVEVIIPSDSITRRKFLDHKLSINCLGNAVQQNVSNTDSCKHKKTYYFQVGTDNDGKIQYMKTDVYENAGCHWNEPVSAFTVEHMKSCYDSSTWAVAGFTVLTDTASNTYCRAPSKFCSTIAHKSNKTIYL
jgi:CO/xanthine dehydrogenase Mo-binding subunit